MWWIEHGKEKHEIELIEEAKRAERFKAKKAKSYEEHCSSKNKRNRIIAGLKAWTPPDLKMVEKIADSRLSLR
ncbi:hypothetical protein J0675_22585 [Vibrio parahaemolyticus]|nr:hypothetical protein [Vibrio parahaemolyticus]